MCALQRILQNFHLVWLDENDDQCRNSIEKLRQIVHTIHTFVDIDECFDFITEYSDETALMIVSETFIQQIISIIQDISQIKAVFVLYHNNSAEQKWTNTRFKIYGEFSDINSVCEAIQQMSKECDHDAVSISFVSNDDKNTLDCSFMYTKILKDVLLTIDFDQSHFNEFLIYCRKEFTGNSKQSKNIDKIQKEYHEHEPVWWYTYESFLYSMLNKALRLMDVDIIMKMCFFLRDLHNHITVLHREQFTKQVTSDSLIVYRGQHLLKSDFDQLKENQGGLLAFNNFLSTSKNRDVSLKFINRNAIATDSMSILFVIHIDPSIKEVPFANVSNISALKREEEILFSMHSVFRIGEIEKIAGNISIWQVKLILTNDDDLQLRKLTKHIQEELELSKGWHRLGTLLIKMAKFDKAEELYEILLRQTNDQKNKAIVFHQFGIIRYIQGKYTEAIEYNEKSLAIIKEILPANDLKLANSYSNIGTTYAAIGEYVKALKFYKISQEIEKKTLPESHPVIGTSYNNIGLVYYELGEYSKALQSYKKSIEIRERTLPANHPDLGISYSSIGILHMIISEYTKAIEYFKKALKIVEKVLSPNHPDLLTIYSNIGSVYDKLGEYSKALEYYNKSIEKREQILSANHPDLAQSYNNVGCTYDNIGDYSNALKYYQKALKICEQTLPENHPYIALCNNNIGNVYRSMEKYSMALEYYEKSLGSREKTLPVNHPDLAQSYNCIGSVYKRMSEYSKALSYHFKAINIMKESVPTNHPDWGICYNNLGLLYCLKGDHKQGLSYFERALNIYRCSLPENHPDVENTKRAIELVKQNM